MRVSSIVSHHVEAFRGIKFQISVYGKCRENERK